MVKLTVVTTTYNHEKYIKQALNGFVMQVTNFPFEVRICDDCSTDKTRDIIEEYRIKYPNIIKPIYNDTNIGPMDNFIRTLSTVNTEYVALCDGDDFWTDSNKLQKQVDFLESHKDFSICFHQTKIFFEDSIEKEQIYPTGIPEETTIDNLVSMSNYIPANTVVYRWMFYNSSKVLKDIFPQNIVPGDYYLHLLHAKTGKIYFMNEIMSQYRRHTSGMWWLNATQEGKEQFDLVYGKKLLNFYDAIEENIQISSKATYIYKKDIIHNAIVSFSKNQKAAELQQFINNKENRNIFNEEMKSIIENSNDNFEFFVKKHEGKIKKQFSDNMFYELNYFQKLMYILFIDSQKRKEIINKKFNFIQRKRNK